MGSTSGFCRDLLQHIKEVTQEATPQYKIQPNGLTGMLLTDMSPGVIKNDSYNGHFKTVVIKKKQRFIRADTDTSASCTNTSVPSYTEDTVAVDQFRQIAFHIPDETMAEYCDEASKTVNVGKPSTPIMAEMLDTLMTAADALLDGVEFDLSVLMNTRFGVNRRTGLATAATININKDSTINPLDDGITRILSDFKRNQMSGRPLIVGEGLFLNYILQQFAKSADQSGLDSKIMAGAFDFWYSDEAASQWGANHIGVFEKDSVQMVQYLRYQGFKAGVKPGASQFGTIPIPIFTKTGIQTVWFDFQLRYNDCPQEFFDQYTGASLGNLGKGWQMILSKQYGLYTIPTNAYKAADVLIGNRGTLRYVISNDCETCS